MKLLTPTLMLMVLVSPVWADDIAPTADRESINVVVQWLPSNATVQRVCSELGAWGGVNPHAHVPVGCNTYNHDTNTQVIYAVKPKAVDDDYTMVLGHELLHGFVGVYH